MISNKGLKDLYKIYLPVQWHSGMLMLPQHFQQQELFRQYQLKQLISGINPYFYGVIDLEYSFENSMVTITKLLAIMPNLLPVCIEEESECISLDLSSIYHLISQNDLNHTGLQKYKLFLTLPEYGLVEKNMQEPELINGVNDEFDFESKEVIVKLKPNIKLVLDKSPPAKHYSIALFEFSMINNQYVIGDYEPTFLAWSDNSQILNKLEDIKNQLRNKLRFLKVQNETSDSNLQFMQQSIASALLPFEEQLNARAHPYEVFKTLIALIGNLAVFIPQPVPVFAYNHDDQTGSFNRCIDYIVEVLQELKEDYARVEFIQEDNVWKVPLSKITVSMIDGKQYFICSMHMLENYEMLDDWLRSCVISSNSAFDQMLKNRVLGASRDILEYVEGLNAKSNKQNLFFNIEIDNKAVKIKDDYLLLYNDKPAKETPNQIFAYKF